jgi:hypothetical protein
MAAAMRSTPKNFFEHGQDKVLVPKDAIFLISCNTNLFDVKRHDDDKLEQLLGQE